MTTVQTAMQSIFRTALRDDVRDALDAAELALRSVERHNHTDTDMDQASYHEAHQLVTRAYNSLAHARQIFEGEAS